MVDIPLLSGLPSFACRRSECRWWTLRGSLALWTTKDFYWRRDRKSTNYRRQTINMINGGYVWTIRDFYWKRDQKSTNYRLRTIDVINGGYVWTIRDFYWKRDQKSTNYRLRTINMINGDISEQPRISTEERAKSLPTTDYGLLTWLMGIYLNNQGFLLKKGPKVYQLQTTDYWHDWWRFIWTIGGFCWRKDQKSTNYRPRTISMINGGYILTMRGFLLKKGPKVYQWTIDEQCPWPNDGNGPEIYQLSM